MILTNFNKNGILNMSLGKADFLCQTRPRVCVEKLTVFPNDRRNGAFLLEVAMPSGVYIRTDYHREIHKKTNPFTGTKGVLKPNSGSFKKGHKLGMIGKKHSEETKIKMSISNTNGEYGFKKGHRSWSKGKHLPEETRIKISEARKDKNTLENHPNWQGGKSFEPYPLSWNKTFKEQIRFRDGYKCQICGVPEIECSRNLHVHHRDFNKKNIELKNLISLCQPCHMKLHWKARNLKT